MNFAIFFESSGERDVRGPEVWRRSVSTRLFIGMAIMFLPLAVLAVSTLILFEGLIGTFIEVTYESTREIQPNLIIQSKIPEAKSELDHYLFMDIIDSRQAFKEQGREINDHFDQLDNTSLKGPQEAAIINKARRHWSLGEKRALKLLSATKPADREVLIGKAATVDNQFARSKSLLQKANRIGLREIGKELKKAQVGRVRTIVIMTAALVVGLMIAGYVGIVLAGSILTPLNELEAGVQRLSRGDMAHRVHIISVDELGKLGVAFNVMAHRLEADQAVLEDMATHDSLTGLLNRREFYHHLDEEIERSRRYKSKLSLLMFDIDRFKIVNDEFGHQAGDSVLRKVVMLITEKMRPVDKAGRYGGEEFTVILPETDGAGGMAVAERIRRAVSSELFVVGDDKAIRLTVSIGAAVFSDDARDEDELVANADKALYAAKRAGRNRVCRYEEGERKTA